MFTFAFTVSSSGIAANSTSVLKGIQLFCFRNPKEGYTANPTKAVAKDIIMTFHEAKIITKTSKIVGGIHINTTPTVLRGILWPVYSKPDEC